MQVKTSVKAGGVRRNHNEACAHATQQGFAIFPRILSAAAFPNDNLLYGHGGEAI